MNGEEGKDTQMEDKNPVLVSKVFLGFQEPSPGQTRPGGRRGRNIFFVKLR